MFKYYFIVFIYLAFPITRFTLLNVYLTFAHDRLQKYFSEFDYGRVLTFTMIQRRDTGLTEFLFLTYHVQIGQYFNQVHT